MRRRWLQHCYIVSIIEQRRRHVRLSTGKPVLEGSSCKENNWINPGIPDAQSSIQSWLSSPGGSLGRAGGWELHERKATRVGLQKRLKRCLKWTPEAAVSAPSLDAAWGRPSPRRQGKRHHGRAGAGVRARSIQTNACRTISIYFSQAWSITPTTRPDLILLICCKSLYDLFFTSNKSRRLTITPNYHVSSVSWFTLNRLCFVSSCPAERRPTHHAAASLTHLPDW